MVYWYYVLAGRMSDADAWNAAVAWDGDEMTFGSTRRRRLRLGHHLGRRRAGPSALLGALQAWAAAAPPKHDHVATVGSERI